MKLDDETKKAYTELERAVKEVLRLRGATGVLTEYCTFASVQSIDDDGDTPAEVMLLLPMGGGLPYHRVLGLVDYVQTVLRAEVARNELGSGCGHDDDSG